VDYVAEYQPGLTDTTVLEQANSRRAVLITLDKDFGELVYRQGKASAGVILLRVAGLSAADKVRTVLAAISAHGSEMVGSFTVVTPGKVRIRRPG
jgi:predicted nuclease of predicted toxin-antitoxin system